MVESVFREAYIFQPATKWTVKNVPWQWFTFIPFDINSYQKKKKKKNVLHYDTPIPLRFFSSRVLTAILSIDNKFEKKKTKK